MQPDEIPAKGGLDTAASVHDNNTILGPNLNARRQYYLLSLGELVAPSPSYMTTESLNEQCQRTVQ